MSRQKQFFRESTKAEIKRKSYIDFKELGDLPIIASLDPNEYTIVPDFIPRGYESYRKFMKHGPEVQIKRIFTLEQAVRLGKTPVQLREEAFDAIKGYNYCGYTILPIMPTEKTGPELRIDERKRKIPLVECVEGARIFAYARQTGVPLKVNPYPDAKRVRIDGAEVIVDVPSRHMRGRFTEGMRMQFKLMSVPFFDCREKYAISFNIGSDHSCPSKRFNIRYRYTDDKESSGIVNICAHEIAAYLELIQQQSDKKNIIPLQMCQFAIPTQETVDYYLKWENNVLVKDESLKAKDKLKKPNRAHKEIALWALVHSLKHDATFYSRASRDGNVQDYNWFSG